MGQTIEWSCDAPSCSTTTTDPSGWIITQAHPGSAGMISSADAANWSDKCFEDLACLESHIASGLV